MNPKKLVIPSALVAIIVFSFFTVLVLSNRNNDIPLRENIEGLETSGKLTLNADMTIRSLNELSNGKYRITYDYFINNNTGDFIYEIKSNNNLNNTFPGLDFNVISLSSDSFSVNNSFDGDQDTSLLSGTDSLAQGAGGRVELVVEFDPENSTGPFENYISVNGVREPTENEDDSGSEQEEDNESGNEDNDNQDNNDESEDNTNDEGEDSGNDDNNEDEENEEENNEEEEQEQPPEEEEGINYENLNLRFWFIDSSGSRIGEIIGLSEINRIESGEFSIEGSTNFEIPGSIRLTIVQTGETTRENVVPYIYKFDDLNNLIWNSEDGTYTVRFEVFEEQNLNGEIVHTEEISFIVVSEENVNELSDEASISFEIEDSGSSESSKSRKNDTSKPKPAPNNPSLQTGEEELEIPEEEVNENTPVETSDEENITEVPFTLTDKDQLENLPNTGIELRAISIITLSICLLVIDLEYIGIIRRMFNRIVK